MPTWGTTATSDDNKPNWLTAEQLEQCYATSAGWVLKQPGGTEEILVAIGGLSTDLGSDNITSISFASLLQSTAAGTVTVYYDEKIEIQSGTPTLAITNSTGADVTSSGVSLDAEGNGVVFAFTIAEGAVSGTPALTVPGTGYSNGATVALTQGAGGTTSNGTGFTCTANISGGVIQSITVTAVGTRYIPGETIGLTDGASGTDARITVGAVTGVASVADQTLGGSADIEDAATAVDADQAIGATVERTGTTFTF